MRGRLEEEGNRKVGNKAGSRHLFPSHFGRENVGVVLWEWGSRGGASWCAALRPKRPKRKILARTSSQHFQMNSVHCLSFILELFLISICRRVDSLCITPSRAYARLAGSSQSLINWWQANIRNGPQPLHCPCHRSQMEAGRREDREQLTPEMFHYFFLS